MSTSIKLFYLLIFITFFSCTLDVGRRKLEGVFYTEMGYCLIDNHCKADSFCLNKNCVDYKNYFQENLKTAFKQKMISDKYAYGFKDNNHYYFLLEDLILNLNNLDKKNRKMDFLINVKPSIVKNTNNPSFEINPLFQINPMPKNTCSSNTLSISVKTLFALSSEVFPAELLKIKSPMEPYFEFYPKLRFHASDNLKTTCQTAQRKTSLICELVKNANIENIKTNKYKISNNNLDVDIEISGKITIFRFNKKYMLCLDDFIKSSEYAQTRTSNIAVFKVLGEIIR